MRETGIFTGTTNSPSRSLRQSYDRYAIRAGRNLPDKEFRYLRTVIVTAAVHWSFSSKLRLAANLCLLPSCTGQASAPIRRFRLCRDLCFCYTVAVRVSLRPLRAVSSIVATLLPKLRV